jgi:hyperosmotically inducible periplasmic protein
MNSRKLSGRIASTTLFVLLAVGVSPAAAQDRFDVRIANAVAHQIDGYAQYSIFDYISGTVENGVVTLTGKVTMPYKKSDIGKKVAAVNGVREVQNRIDVLPVSTFDEELRLKIARAIYGNSAFWRYAARANPPIHILVERGHVTLVGVVNSQVDRALARSLATGLGELSVTNDLHTDVEARSH